MDLDLYLDERLVAHTRPVARGARVRIDYEDWVEDSYPAETSLLSCSLPVGYSSEPGAAQAFLEGLLPEGRALESMAAGLAGVALDSSGAPGSVTDTLLLLVEYGRECAGAVTILPRGAAAPSKAATYAELDEDAVAAMLEALPEKPLGADRDRDIRMSLAGAQPKLLLARIDGRWQEPLGGAASTHILKPTGRWPSSSDNECVVMRLARAIGLCDTDVWVEEFGDSRAFVTQRFDRRIVEGTVRRLHQEDLCQALKVRPKDKYDIGRLSDRPARLFQEKSDDPSGDATKLFQQLVFRVLVGDEDGHGKNYGLTLADGAVAIAPMYDSLSTVAYSGLTGSMGTPIGRQSNLARVDRAALLEEGAAFHLRSLDIVDDMAEAVRRELDRLDFASVDPHVAESILMLIHERVNRLLRGEPLGLPTARFRIDTLAAGAGNLDQQTNR